MFSVHTTLMKRRSILLMAFCLSLLNSIHAENIDRKPSGSWGKSDWNKGHSWRVFLQSVVPLGPNLCRPFDDCEWYLARQRSRGRLDFYLRPFTKNDPPVAHSAEGKLNSNRSFKDRVWDRKLWSLAKNGIPLSNWNFENGTLKDGHWELWFNRTVPALRVDIRNGKLDGDCQYFHENGSVAGSAHFVDGKLHGGYREWYENGVTRTTGTFIQDKKTGNFMQVLPDKTKVSEENFDSEGILHGAQREWLGGKLYRETYYQHGLKHGLEKFLYRKKYEDAYVTRNRNNGVLEGISMLTTTKGKNLQKLRYKNGKLNGQCLFDDPGTGKVEIAFVEGAPKDQKVVVKGRIFLLKFDRKEEHEVFYLLRRSEDGEKSWRQYILAVKSGGDSVEFPWERPIPLALW